MKSMLATKYFKNTPKKKKKKTNKNNERQDNPIL